MWNSTNKLKSNSRRKFKNRGGDWKIRNITQVGWLAGELDFLINS